MNNILSTIVSSCLLAASAAAQPLASFESSLGVARSTVLQIQNERRQARILAAADDLKKAAKSGRRLVSEADALAYYLDNIRQRADQLEPGQIDPALMSDLSVLLYDLQSFDEDVQALSLALSGLEHSVPADPNLKELAQDMVNIAHRLRSSTARDYSAAQWTQVSLSRLGWAASYGIQAKILIQDALQAAADAEASANNIKKKISG